MKLKITMLLVFIIISFLISVFIRKNSGNQIERILKSNTENLSTYYSTLQYHQSTIADLIYEDILQMKGAVKILSILQTDISSKKKNILRKKLHDMLSIKYENIQKLGVSQLHFASLDNKTLLSMSGLSRFGDLIPKTRYGFRYVNRTHKIFRGFIKDKMFLAFREIYPIFDKKGNYVCALDIAYPSEVFQRYFTTIGKLHSHMLIKKSLFSPEIWKKKSLKMLYVQSAENSNYMLALTQNHPYSRCVAANSKKLKFIKNDIKNRMKKKKSFSLYRNFRGKITVVSFLPIVESDNKKISAWVVSYKANYEIGPILIKAIVVNIMFVFIIFMILYFIYRTILQKEILQKRVEAEVAKNRDKDKHMLQQSRLAQMGEMISMIAHQWRQPLSAINATSGSLRLKAELNNIDNQTVIKLSKKISDYSLHLSSTIDDFREFFKSNKKREEVNYTYLIDGVLDIAEISLVSRDIKLVKKLNSKMVFNLYPNEIKQVILNIIKNAEDTLLEREVENPTITIETKRDILMISDNGGGISKDVIDKIFDPYFSTKEKKDGTGLGLYMSKTIIEEHCGGKLSVENSAFGAVFKIWLPKT